MEEYPFEQRVLGWILHDKAEKNRRKVFLQFNDSRITYQEIDRISNRVANSFLKMGVRQGDKVCLILKNCPEFLYTWFGLSKIGAVEVPINTDLKGDLLKYIIKDSDAGIIVVDREFVERIRYIEPELENVRRVIIKDDDGRTSYGIQTPWDPFPVLLEGSDLLNPLPVHPFDPIAIMYTSGTTGPSKGVLMPNRQFYDWGHDYAVSLGIRSDDVLYTCLPFFHGTSHFIVTMMALLSDATLAMGAKFSASRFWDEVAAHQATFVPLVGAMATILYNRPVQPGETNHKVRLIYSLPAPRDIYREFEQRFNVKLIEAYGLTEVNAPFFNPLDAPRIGSCGKKVQNYEVALFNEWDQEVRPGEIGEIVIRPKEPYSMMLEYYKKPQETLRAWRNLWFHTGDLAFEDRDGYFYFVDRKKDSIRRRGENVSSYEVEKVLNSNPKILESAVFGIDSDLSEQEIKACIRLKPKASMTPEEVIAFCQDRMAYFMVPRFIEFKEEFPKTQNGKVEKYKLRQEGNGTSTWDLEKSGIKVKR
ncbi:MAG: ATP-dependent acyl-CoA ligase [Deltaproteobacteria bacterium]|nr:MAG: ATP-dependent acyl-CoA ligase [Deltaproteobacteria bacterium]